MSLGFKVLTQKKVFLAVTKSGKNKNTFLGDVPCLTSRTIKVAINILYLQL